MNDLTLTSRPGATLLTVWDERVAARPEAVAVSGRTSLTYRQIDQLSNRLARRLRQLGIGPGDRVALLCDRQPRAVAAFWGVLKAGAVFVGLDPAAGADRLQAVLADATPKAILVCGDSSTPGEPAAHRAFGPDLGPSPADDPTTAAGLVVGSATAPPTNPAIPGSVADPAVAGDVYPTSTVVPILEALFPPSLVFDLADEVWLSPDPGPLDRPPDPDHPALLLYPEPAPGAPPAPGAAPTRPAVVEDHAGLAALVAADIPGDLFFHHPDPVVLAVAGHHQAAFLLDTVLPLVRGLRVVTPPAADLAAPGGLGAWVERERATVIVATRASLAPHLAAADRRWLARLRVLALHGRDFSPAFWSELRPVTPALLIRLYGPVESGGLVAFTPVIDPSVVGLGYPVPSIRVHIVDESGVAVADGQAGELCLSGPGLARGYRHEPLWLRGRFAATWDGERRFHTGDLVRRQPDGRLELLGRLPTPAPLPPSAEPIHSVRSTPPLEPVPPDGLVPPSSGPPPPPPPPEPVSPDAPVPSSVESPAPVPPDAPVPLSVEPDELVPPLSGPPPPPPPPALELEPADNPTDEADDTAETAVSRFQAVVARSPQATAVSDPSGLVITYAMLDLGARRLAAALRASGIASGQSVALLADRGVDFYCGLLGILYSGAAYVPLDPADPPERTTARLAAAEVTAVVIDDWALSERAAARPVVSLLDPELSRQPADPPDRLAPADVAARLFVDRPGTEATLWRLTQRALVQTADSAVERLGLTDRDSVLAHAGPADPAAVWDWVQALLTGAAVRVVPAAVAADCDQLRDCLATGVTVATLPAYLAALVGPAPLRVLATTGAAAVALADFPGRLVRLAPDGRPIPALPPPTDDATALAAALTAWPQATDAAVIVHPAPADRSQALTVPVDRSGAQAVLADRSDAQAVPADRLDTTAPQSGPAPGLVVGDGGVVDGSGPAPLLAAYVAGSDGLDLDALRAALAARLPDVWARLSSLQRVDLIPRAADGGVDARALPGPAGQPPAIGSAQSAVEAAGGVVLGRPLAPDGDFLALGGEGRGVIRLREALTTRGWSVTAGDIVTGRTPQAIAAVISRTCQVAPAPQGELTGLVDLTPGQAGFVGCQGARATILASHRPFDITALRAALTAVNGFHDALRARLADDHQDIAPAAEAIGPRLDVRLWAREPSGLEAVTAATALAASLDPVAGPLWGAHLWRTPTGDRLLLAVHRFAADATSFALVVSDVLTAWRQAAAGKAIDLGRKTASLKAWNRAWADALADPALQQQLNHWRDNVTAVAAAQLPLSEPDRAAPDQTTDEGAGSDRLGAGGAVSDRSEAGGAESDGLETVGAAPSRDRLDEAKSDRPPADDGRRRFSQRLDREQTNRLLTTSLQPYSTTVADLIVAAAAWAVREVYGLKAVAIEVEGDGRRPLGDRHDWSRTVGWLAHTFPLIVPTSPIVAAAVVAAKEAFRAVPQGGFGYARLAQLPGSSVVAEPVLAVRLELGPEAGALGPDVALSDWPTGRLGDAAARTPPVVLTAAVDGDGLELSLDYAADRLGAATAWRLVVAVRDGLAGIIEHCAAQSAPLQTAADVGAPGLDDATIAVLNAAASRDYP
ncbi:MAG: AMP-binding protein [Propionibacteriaceae bacterium]|nr:AMP-binding protein [Propionibacteriaceae bacterium]